VLPPTISEGTIFENPADSGHAQVEWKLVSWRERKKLNVNFVPRCGCLNISERPGEP
jgi:hypothetical protein